MDIGSILLIFSAALLSAAFISRPFLERKKRGASIAGDGPHGAEQQRAVLSAGRERVLSALRDLDFDFKMGKVPGTDYSIQRQLLLGRGASLLRQLDEIEASRGGLLDGKPGNTPARAEGEDFDQVEALIRERRSNRQERSAGFCPRCGKPALRSDRFCSGCGATLGGK